MSEQVKLLITELVSEAKARGITQGGLAKMAKLTPAGLSKAKKKGAIQASNLALLADLLDLELTLQPRHANDTIKGRIKSGTLFQTGTSVKAQGNATKKESTVGT